MEVERFEDWVGAEVVDSRGETIGKLEEVYFNDDRPVIAVVRGGHVLRKHYVVPLKDATVTRNRVIVAFAADDLLKADDASRGVTPDDVAGLDEAYGVHLAVPANRLEGSKDRAERLAAAAQAEDRAQVLEADATRKTWDAADAAASADVADAQADHAEAERRDATRAAEAARRAVS